MYFPAITCPKLRVPENGYLVKASACSNVVHEACGIRCRIGFHLTGDSIRLCGKDGSWSGNEPQCLCKFFVYVKNMKKEMKDFNILTPNSIMLSK